MLELANPVNDNQKAPRNSYLVLLLVFVCRVYINLKMSSFCEKTCYFPRYANCRKISIVTLFFFLYFYMQAHKQKVYFKMCPHFVSSYDYDIKVK